MKPHNSVTDHVANKSVNDVYELVTQQYHRVDTVKMN